MRFRKAQDGQTRTKYRRKSSASFRSVPIIRLRLS
nr:MAG TPA: hypothetical protein [Caudoviricetes sp.]